MPFKRGNKLGGRRGSRNSHAARVSTPVRYQSDDVDNDVGDEDAEDTTNATPQDDNADDPATPAQDDEDDDDDDDGDDTQLEITSFPRRKPGRPRGSINKRSRRDQDSPDPGDDGSESGTPRRRRGRPPGSGPGRGRGGYRGRRKALQPETPRVVIDKSGTTLDVVNDEACVDEDEEGITKVDANGVLQGGREYRVRTFTIMGRGGRLYMLSTEPARCTGFRDSYLFFAKHPKLYKVLVAEDEKKDLIEREILPNSYKGRNIGVVTARSVYREFGARIVVGGRKIIDDFKVAQARANGDIEGELADPDDRLPDSKDQYNRNRYVAWFGASDVYRQSGPGGGPQIGKPGPIGKRRTNVTTSNWQSLHSRESSRFNSALIAVRNMNRDGVYDANTNMLFYPKIMQPTHVKWELVPPPSSSSGSKQLTGGLANGHLSNGDSQHLNDSMDIDENLESKRNQSQFGDVPAVISRNFTVVDTQYEAPPITNAGFPGPDGSITDPCTGPNGLSAIPTDLIDELPEDCRRAFMEAKAAEIGWKSQWGTEQQSALRGDLKIGFVGYPV